MKIIIFSLIIILCIPLCTYAQNVVQIATTRDATGHWNNWLSQIVTWDLTVLTDAPDHLPMSYKSAQTWYLPTTDTSFIKATFTRKILGAYAIRWSMDNGDIWSDSSSVIILKPNHGKSS